MSDINEVLEADLAAALKYLVDYQRALYTLNAPDPQRQNVLALLNKYKVQGHKPADGYKVVVKDGDKTVNISKDPEGALVDEEGQPLRLAIDYTTGETILAPPRDRPKERPVPTCPFHDIPLNARGECHRCGFDINDMPIYGHDD